MLRKLILSLAVASFMFAPMLSAEWVEVAKFSGSGIKNTDDFQISSAKLRVSWKIVKQGPAGLFQVTIQKGDKMVAMVGNVSENQEESSVHRSGPGEYYLKINSYGMKWRIVVAEDK